MKRVILSSQRHATSSDARRIFNQLKETCPGNPTLIKCGDEAIVWTVNGQKLSVNFKFIDAAELERRIYDKSECVLEGNYCYIWD